MRAKGRGMAAERPVSAGEIAFAEEPVLLVVEEDCMDCVCAGCLQFVTGLSRIGL